MMGRDPERFRAYQERRAAERRAITDRLTSGPRAGLLPTLGRTIRAAFGVVLAWLRRRP